MEPRSHELNSFASNSQSYSPIENKVSQEESDKPPSSPGTNVYSDKQDNLNPSGSFGGAGANAPILLNQSDSIGSGKIPPTGQKELEDLSIKKKDASSFNQPYVTIEKNKIEQSICDEDDRKQSYIKRIEKVKSDAQSYEEKPQEEKTKYMKDYKILFEQLHYIVKSSSRDKEGLAKTVEALEQNFRDFLANWGPKRCLMYLKLASVYGKIGNNLKADMLSKAEEDLNEVSDAGDIAECRRWLYLQRVESRMDNDVERRKVDKEGKLLEKCWNVKQRCFEGRRDFLDFYAIFLAKHLLRLGEYKKAERAHLDALALRSQREKFWDQDDFDWSKLEKEVKNDIEERKNRF